MATSTSLRPPPPVVTTTKSDGRVAVDSHQLRVFLRSLVILFSLFFFAAALLHWRPSQPWLGWLPMYAIAGVSYLSYFPRSQLRLRSYLRLASLLTAVGAHQTVVVLLLWGAAHLLLGVPSMAQWRYALLMPYIFAFCVFGRLSPGLTRGDPRRWLVHGLYDPPALFVCWVYSQVLRAPLNRLFTPITDSLFLGSLPFSGDVQTLAAAGVTGVVNMCEEYSGPLEQYTEFGIQQCYCPTVDMTAPTLADLSRAVVFISRHLHPETAPDAAASPSSSSPSSSSSSSSPSSSSSSSPSPSGGGGGAGGRKPRVLIHCKCGMSRSACVVLCYLASTGTMTPIEALRLIKRTRPEVSTDLFDYPSVQAYMQALPHVSEERLEKDKVHEKAKEEAEGQTSVITDTIKQRLVP